MFNFELYFQKGDKTMLGLTVLQLNLLALGSAHCIKNFCVYPTSMNDYLMKHVSGLLALYVHTKFLHFLMERRINSNDPRAGSLLKLKEPEFFTSALKESEKWKKIFFQFQKNELKRHPREYQNFLHYDWTEFFKTDWTELNQKFLESFTAKGKDEMTLPKKIKTKPPLLSNLVFT